MFRRDNDTAERALTVLVEEYKAYRTEILSLLAGSRQVVALTLTALGVLIAATPYIVQSRATPLFLVAPLLFFALALTHLKYVLYAQDLDIHLRGTVTPAIRQLIGSSKQDASRQVIAENILSGDRPRRGTLRIWVEHSRLVGLLALPIAGANYGIPILGAVFAIGAYIFLAITTNRHPSTAEITFLGLDGVGLVYTAIWGVVPELRH